MTSVKVIRVDKKERNQMKKATPDEMRDSLKMAKTLRKAGIRFVPVPVEDQDDYLRLVVVARDRLAKVSEGGGS